MPPRTRTLRARLPRPTRPDQHAPTDGSVLAVCGELDFLTAEQICRRIQALAGPGSAVTVDLAGAFFYDQAALEAVADAHAHALRAGCRLTFIHAPAALLARTAAHARGRRPRRARTGRARTDTTITTA
jgi:anti-anti-sigma regulatory factor